MNAQPTSPQDLPTRFSHRGLGIALGVLGATATVFALAAIGISFVQELMLRSFPAPAFAETGGDLPPPDQFFGVMKLTWTVWRTHFPVWAVGGIAMVVGGVRLSRLRPGSVAQARGLCLLAVGAQVAYCLDVWFRVLPAMAPLFSAHPLLPGGSFRTLAAASMAGTQVALLAPLAVLLWGLRTRRS